jgi:rhomboid protease GluP
MGGLISGMAIGYAFVPGLKKKDDPIMENILIAVLSVVIVIGSAFVCKSITPFEIKKYDESMSEFASTEQMALQAFNMPQDTPRSRLLYEIEHRSIYYWKENIKLINKADSLYLPDAVHERNKKILRYCKLRLEHSLVVLRAIEEDTNKYQTQIEDLNQKIEAIVSELTGK